MVGRDWKHSRPQGPSNLPESYAKSFYDLDQSTYVGLKTFQLFFSTL